ncbi:hypothetical protein CK203_080960 [Vitis vinifera]|uniref:Reverse transcriptase zinc-binding domain-containing protein n=1 Tax=Vitis vinifera TaxID=29760 RepID=A0A438EMS0_VITVI|nr:hypothetical protein CK203_080960 [Vitis vinifera]
MENYLEYVCSYQGGLFAWEASWGKVLTQDQLKRRGWNLANRCPLCCDEEETINHILIHCSKAKVLWDLLFSLFGVNWVLPFSVRDTLLGWHAPLKDKKHSKVWRAAPLCLFWMQGSLGKKKGDGAHLWQGRQGVGLWRAIRKGWDAVKSKSFFIEMEGGYAKVVNGKGMLEPLFCKTPT